MIVDGRAIAKEIVAQVRKKTEGSSPSFVAFVVAPSSATRSYLLVKERQAHEAGIVMHVRELPESITTEEMIEAILLVEDDAVIVQLPLPAHIDTEQVLEALPVEKDADVLSIAARDHGPLMHPIAASVADILQRGSVSVLGLHAVVVGQGWLVGQPVAKWLRNEGAHVEVVTRETGNLSEALLNADIVVSGAGSPGLVTASMVREGAIVIDVGTSELGGSIAGDVAPEVAQKAALFTAVPGGVGPVAVSYLMKNVATLSRLRKLP